MGERITVLFGIRELGTEQRMSFAEKDSLLDWLHPVVSSLARSTPGRVVEMFHPEEPEADDGIDDADCDDELTELDVLLYLLDRPGHPLRGRVPCRVEVNPPDLGMIVDVDTGHLDLYLRDAPSSAVPPLRRLPLSRKLEELQAARDSSTGADDFRSLPHVLRVGWSGLLGLAERLERASTVRDDCGDDFTEAEDLDAFVRERLDDGIEPSIVLICLASF